MKLLIVDDEDIIREGIVEKIAWKENGFTLTTPGKNGLDAKEIIDQLIENGADIIDFPAPVSPVKTIKPFSNSISNSSIIAKFSIFSSLSISFLPI